MFGKKPSSVDLQSQRLESLGQFAGGIAHDFNNILSIIEGYTRLAIKQLGPDAPAAEQLEKILTSTQRGAGLTRQLLAFGRQKIALEEKISLFNEIEQQKILLKPLLGEAVTLYVSHPGEALWVNAATDHITQIIVNLALNARDAMKSKGELAIVTMRCPKRDIPARLKDKKAHMGYARISVIDSGSGIAPDILPRIFDPFFTTKGQGSGTGLGLSVVYGLVDQLGGTIEVQSEHGKGSVFEVFLPLCEAPAQAASEEQDGCELAGKTVLLAEDETELRDVLALMLGDMKMKVITAGNGNEALMLQDDYDGEIDFLLTDVVMPEMDGVRLGELFKSLRPQSSVVYMSGYPFIEGQGGGVRMPESEQFLAKPLQEEKVRAILQRALQRKQKRMDRQQGEDDGARV